MSILLVALTIAISLIKLGQGLESDFRHLVTTANWWLILRGVLAAVILVPILFLVLILIFKPSTAITLAIMCMAVSPAADLSTNQVEKLGGDKHLAEGVLLISSLISIATAPLLLKLFELILELHLEIDLKEVVQQVAIAQFIPVMLSLVLRKIFPNLKNLASYLINIASVLLICCFILIIIQKHTTFAEFKINAYIAIILVTSSAFILGAMLAGNNFKQQIALAIESSMRNPGLAFLIASENFSVERANLAMVPYLVTTMGTIIICTLIFKSLHRYFVKR